MYHAPAASGALAATGFAAGHYLIAAAALIFAGIALVRIIPAKRRKRRAG